MFLWGFIVIQCVGYVSYRVAYYFSPSFSARLVETPDPDVVLSRMVFLQIRPGWGVGRFYQMGTSPTYTRPIQLCGKPGAFRNAKISGSADRPGGFLVYFTRGLALRKHWVCHVTGRVFRIRSFFFAPSLIYLIAHVVETPYSVGVSGRIGCFANEAGLGRMAFLSEGPPRPKVIHGWACYVACHVLFLKLNYQNRPTDKNRVGFRGGRF